MILRYMAFTTAVVVLLTSCSSNGNPDQAKLPPTKQLEAFRAERSKLDEKIKALELQLGKSNPNGADVPVTTVLTQEAPFVHRITVKGTVESRSSVSVAPEVPGRIVAIHVQNGQLVKKGDLIVELDGELVRKGIDELATQLDFATTLYDKQQRIYDQKAGSEIQYLQAKNNKEALEKRLASLNEQLSHTRIKAPTTGFVDGLQPKAGEMASPGVPMMTIVNTSDMRVVADLAETYVRTVSNGDPVTVAFYELGDTIHTKLGNVAQNINPVNRTFRVEIPVKPVPAKLRPNSTCDISINDLTIPNAITIPLEGVIRHEDKSFAYVIEGNVARKREIVTGMVSGAMVEITSGISANEQVVVRGVTSLSDGQRVHVIQ